jgi:hypothetical protein
LLSSASLALIVSTLLAMLSSMMRHSS